MAIKLSVWRLVLAVVLVLTGAAAIIAGVAFIYWPAALVIGGAFLLLAGGLAVRVAEPVAESGSPRDELRREVMP